MIPVAENMKQQHGGALHEELDHDAYTYAMQLVSFSVLPMTLRVAVEVGLLNLISASGSHLSAEEITARLETSNSLASPIIERILRLLCSYSILTFSSSTDAQGRSIVRYGAAPVCRYLAPDKNGNSIASLVLMIQDKVLMDTWYHFKDTLLKGESPFNSTYGMSLFDYTAKDLRFNALFNDAMKGHTHIIMNKVMESYPGFHDVDVVVDIGGGLGSTLKMIVERYPHIKGINFDLPHVISQAAHIPGVEHVGGDMFDAIPSGDLILMKWILHDWSDESSIKVLKNCRNSLHKNGKVVIVEYIIPDEPQQTSEARVVFHADMIMLAHNPGGKERKEEEFKNLAKKSGFSRFNSQYFYANACVMEFIK